MDDAEGLRRRAENLLALAKKARDDHHTQLGSGLIDHSQKMTVAAIQIADKNV